MNFITKNLNEKKNCVFLFLLSGGSGGGGGGGLD